MNMLSKEQLISGPFSIWTLKKLITKDYPETPAQHIVDFVNNDEFLENFGGFIPVEIKLFPDYQFEVIYQLDLGPITGKGNWEINNGNLVLKQDTGDIIQLLDVKLDEQVLSAAYEYLSSDKGIASLTFTTN